MNCCQQTGFPYDLLVACIAVVISFVSVVLTYFTIHLQKKHNKLSVKPIPEFKLSTVGGISIELENKGIGPMICKKLTTMNSSGVTKNHIRDFLPKELHFKRCYYNTLRENFSILPNESIKLISIEIDLKVKRQNKSIITAANIIGDLNLKLEYTSVYNESFPCYSKLLDWIQNSINNHK